MTAGLGQKTHKMSLQHLLVPERKVLTKQRSKKPQMGAYGKDTGEKISILVKYMTKKMKKRQVSHVKEFLITFVDNLALNMEDS